MADYRRIAEAHFENGWCDIAAAFDLADCREWRFDPMIQQRAQECLETLRGLFHESDIRQNRRVIAANAAALSARTDTEFRDFLQSALRGPQKSTRRAVRRD